MNPWNGSHCLDFQADDGDEETPKNEEECISEVCSELCTSEGARWEQECAAAKRYFDSQNRGQEEEEEEEDDDDDDDNDDGSLPDDDPDDPTDDECWYRGGGRCSEACTDDEGHRDWLVRIHSAFGSPAEHFALIEEYNDVWALHCKHVGALIEMLKNERTSGGERPEAVSTALAALLKDAESQQIRCYGEEEDAKFSLRPMAERWSAYMAAKR